MAENLAEKLKEMAKGSQEIKIPKTPGHELEKAAVNVQRGLEEKGEKLDTKAQLRMLERERIRTANLKKIIESLPKEEQEKLKDVNIDSIKAKKLLELEMKHEGFLSSSFAFKQTKDKDGNIIEEPLDPKNVNEGETVFIDFGRNSSANRKIGAGDILPPSVRIIKVIDVNGNVKIGTRMTSGSKVGYYDEQGRYLTIFNNYKISIPQSSELSNLEYAKFGIKSVMLKDEMELKKLDSEEKISKAEYIKLMDKQEQVERSHDIVSEISSSIGDTKTYKEKLQKIILKAKELKSQESKYSKEDLDMIIARLEKTLSILGDKDFGFDWNKYKEGIAMIESEGNGLYYARNDNAGKSRGVSSENWAWGKYQFTTETLRGFGVDLGRPPEESNIQEFLGNYALQEEIMDKHMIQCLEGYVLPNHKVMGRVESKEHSMAFFLAKTHIGGPGSLKREGGSDWLGTNVDKYALKVEKFCA